MDSATIIQPKIKDPTQFYSDEVPTPNEDSNFSIPHQSINHPNNNKDSQTNYSEDLILDTIQIDDNDFISSSSSIESDDNITIRTIDKPSISNSKSK